MKPQVEVESRMAKRGERRRTARRVTRRTRAWAVVVVHRWTPSLEAGGSCVSAGCQLVGWSVHWSSAEMAGFRARDGQRVTSHAPARK
jgi:hypothetical protein